MESSSNGTNCSSEEYDRAKLPILIKGGSIKVRIMLHQRHRPSRSATGSVRHVLKQCEELLSSMGLVCVHAPGEAEALCAYLNHDGLVYGVISQDSDCFAYEAVRVFRNVCTSQNGGSVDIYDMDKVRQVMYLGQEKIVVMGLLSGCDYCPAGVPGVGREMINRLLNFCLSSDILSRIRSWRKSADRLTELELKVDDENVCADCGHCGKTFVHRRAGCQDCRTKSGCDDSRWKNQRTNIKAELDIKRKALLDPGFPRLSTAHSIFSTFYVFCIQHKIKTIFECFFTFFTPTKKSRHCLHFQHQGGYQSAKS